MFNGQQTTFVWRLVLPDVAPKALLHSGGFSFLLQVSLFLQFESIVPALRRLWRTGVALIVVLCLLSRNADVPLYCIITTPGSLVS